MDVSREQVYMASGAAATAVVVAGVSYVLGRRSKAKEVAPRLAELEAKANKLDDLIAERLKDAKS